MVRSPPKGRDRMPERSVARVLRYGVPPSGGEWRVGRMTWAMWNTLEPTNVKPAEAGTPNPEGGAAL